jgi:hypothetical protein
MKASETKAAELFKSDIQLTVPVWQRPYSWYKSEWDALWKDICRVDEKSDKLTHFLGSVVLRSEKFEGLPDHSQRYEIVDGQQRVATLTILLVAIRDRIGEIDGVQVYNDLTDQLLVNAKKIPAHRPRLVLQSSDEKCLRALVEGENRVAGRVTDCYEFFRDLLKTKKKRSEINKIISLINTKLEIVWINIDESDNAHRVFQTINAGGRPLEQTDLVRNFFFLLLGGSGKDFYEKHWRGLESRFDSRELGRYFSAWTTAQGHAGSSKSLFSYFHSDLAPHERSPGSVREYGEKLVRDASLFSVILGKEKDKSDDVESSMSIMRKWGTTPADGLLFTLFRLRDESRMKHADLKNCIDVLFSFFARRFIGGYEPNLHRSICSGVARRIVATNKTRGNDIVTHLRVLLSSGSELKRWPNDEYVIAQSVSTSIYSRARVGWTKCVLEYINSSLVSNPKLAPSAEEYASCSVEHIMPQELPQGWVDDMKKWGINNTTDLHQNKLHVLGNLTLTKINSELSNKRLVAKLKAIQDDSLKINKELKVIDAWTTSTIEERSRRLAGFLVRGLISPMSKEDISKTPFTDDVEEEVLGSELEDSNDDGNDAAE